MTSIRNEKYQYAVEKAINYAKDLKDEEKDNIIDCVVNLKAENIILNLEIESINDRFEAIEEASSSSRFIFKLICAFISIIFFVLFAVVGDEYINSYNYALYANLFLGISFGVVAFFLETNINYYKFFKRKPTSEGGPSV